MEVQVVMAVTLWDFKIKDIEDVDIFQIGRVAGIRICPIWRDVAELEYKVALCHGNGRFQIILKIAPVVLVINAPLQVLRFLFDVGDTTPYMLMKLEFTEIRQYIWHHWWYHKCSIYHTV